MRILSRHFLTWYLKLFAVILFSSTIAIALIEVMLNFESVLEHRNGPMGIATYLLLRIPTYYFRDLIPIACFAAAFGCIGLAARSHEVTAIKSGGISPLMAAIPLLCAAAALSGLTLLFNETVVLQASRAWSKERHPEGAIAFRQGAFWAHRGNAIYRVQEADREARILRGVSVYELSPRGRLQRVVLAERVEVGDDGHWRFFDTNSRILDPGDPAEPPRVERLSEWNRNVTTESDLLMLEASAQMLSLPRLATYIDTQVRAGRNAARHLALYRTRLSGPLTVFAFVLIALPLGFAVGQSRSFAASGLSGIVLLAVYFTARSTAEFFADRGFLWAATGPWVILAVFTGYGMWQLHRVPR